MCMGVEESPYSSLSVFAALKAFSYDIIDRLPLLGTLQNRVLLSFHKIPFLHNVHATDIINILFIFLFFVNSSMKPPNWHMFQLKSHSIEVLCNTFPIFSPYPRCHIPLHWLIQNVAGYSCQRLSWATDEKHLRTAFYQDKTAVSERVPRSLLICSHQFLAGEVTVEKWTMVPLKGFYLFGGSLKDFWATSGYEDLCCMIKFELVIIGHLFGLSKIYIFACNKG